MAYIMKEGDVSVFKNETANEKQPQYKGTCFVHGEEMEIALWVRESQSGKKYFSGQIKEKYKKEEGLKVIDRDEANDDLSLPF